MKTISDSSVTAAERIAAWAERIDHTNLKPEATAAAIEILCREARYYGMAAVCVQPARLALAVSCLRESPVKLCTVIGFPLGADGSTVKHYAARQALQAGADELDMVIDLGAVKDGDYAAVAAEIQAVAALKAEWDFILKVIVETALLSEPELIRLTALVSDSAADYIKTSTGFAARGASLRDLQIINAHRAPHLKIKASGGIRTAEQARALVAAGADRLGCSGSVALLEELGRPTERAHG